MTKTPHDALFKSVFQNPENAVAELQHVLAPKHVAAIDWSRLKLLDPQQAAPDSPRRSGSDLCCRTNSVLET